MPSTTHSDLPGLLQRVPDSGLVANIEAREMITSQQLQALRNDEIDLGFARPGDGSTRRKRSQSSTTPTVWSCP